jgi:hypothetical protein
MSNRIILEGKATWAAIASLIRGELMKAVGI